ncbi:MAG TPA: Ig-like domain repeat protein, partial [Chloroflexota bacterium]|nr:Ig-like domain repeat protein [Chloroflexota bacterium]
TNNDTSVTPSGSVEFFDGATDLGAGSALSGSGNSATSTFSIGTLSAATHSIKAVFTDSAGNFAGSNGTLSPGQTITAAGTSVDVKTNNSPSKFGQPVTFTATVTNNDTSVAPAGGVEFYDGNNDLGPGTTLSPSTNTATSTFTTNSLSITDHTIYAYYSDPAANFVSSNGSVDQVVNPNSTPLTLTALPQTVTYGQPIDGSVDSSTVKATGLTNGDTLATLVSHGLVLDTTYVPGRAHGATGHHGIAPAGLSDSNYSPITYNAGTITVKRANLTITTDNKYAVWGSILPRITIHANFVAGDTKQSLVKQPKCGVGVMRDKTRHITSEAGHYQIVCKKASDPNYKISYVNNWLYVSRSPVDLTYEGATTIPSGGSGHMAVKLTTAAGMPMPNRQIMFTLISGGKGQTCTSGFTNTNGMASCNIPNVHLASGPATVQMFFAGDKKGVHYDLLSGTATTGVTIS